jgi:prephenate dehydrogenase
MNIDKNVKLKVCIIGAGRVGITFAYLIKKTGRSRTDNSTGPEFILKAICSQSSKSIEEAKKFLGCKKGRQKNTARDIFKPGILFSGSNPEGVFQSDVILVCTPDDEIKNVSEEIAEESKKRQDGVRSENPIKDKIFIHFSGAKSLDVFAPLSELGAAVASIHPIKSFASVKDSIETMENTFYGITYPEKCPRKLKEIIKKFIKNIKGKIIEVDDSKKAIYHAAACVASNYLVSLINYSVFLNEKIGINEKDTLNGLIGLVEGTVSNIKKFGTKKALTGPIARGDTGTIREHIKNFEKYLKAEESVIYRVLGGETVKIAFENGWISKKMANEFRKILS